SDNNDHNGHSLQYVLGMTATLSHRSDPNGIQLKSIFQNVIYGIFFPFVEYLEALPTLKFGQDMPTYAHILKTSFQSSDSRSASALWKKTLSLTQFLLKLGSVHQGTYITLMYTFLLYILKFTYTLKKNKGLKMKSTIENTIDAFVNGHLQVSIHNVNIVNEGFNLPSVDCIVMARITSSEIVFVQQLGRALRRDPICPDKQVCILDLALNLRRR
ncbi:hypothetical protein RFI_31239, partial [Reticulomyxa filosa]